MYIDYTQAYMHAHMDKHTYPHSSDFTWSAKPALQKLTSHLSLVMQQCTGSV